MWLLLVTPDAEALVGKWRAEHDWSARCGIPAHVTVRSPFLDSQRWDDPALPTLEEFLPVSVTLARLENRPGALVIVVEPDDALREITAAAGRIWPELPPHKGARPEFAYHVTVVRTPDGSVRQQAATSIAPSLPLTITGTEFWVTSGSPGTLEHRVVASTRGRA